MSSTQLTLFSTLAVQSNHADISVKEARESGITAALDHADQEWVERAKEVLRLICERQQEFISDDVLMLLLSKYPSVTTKNHQAIAGILRFGSHQHWCESTGQYIKTSHKRSHGRAKNTWRSLVYTV